MALWLYWSLTEQYAWGILVFNIFQTYITGVFPRPFYLVCQFHSSLDLAVQVIIDVELLGFVYHWGLEVNSITVIGECLHGRLYRWRVEANYIPVVG